MEIIYPEKVILPIKEIRSCARCGGDHKDINFVKLVIPHDGAWTHWAPCPANGQPILLRIMEDNAPPKEQVNTCKSHPGGRLQDGDCLPCKLGWPAEDGVVDDQAHGEEILKKTWA